MLGKWRVAQQKQTVDSEKGPDGMKGATLQKVTANVGGGKGCVRASAPATEGKAVV